ncbi:MAG: hypothetical protein M3Y42_00590 [Actinomycetota bacterium]|nr:hypothetical protein [Actinomycetota bacterium]MDQ2955449.1 hypothetical protein [Actinomycetota bacterium]
MAPVITESREGLRARREAIYADLKRTPEEFRHHVETATLTGNEWDARDELEEISFLLGEDTASQ